MKNSYIEIIGHLEKDIEIRETKKGTKYGVIWVEEKRGYNTSLEKNIIANITYLFKIYIWNQENLDKYTHLLKQGSKVLVMGEIKIVDKEKEAETINYNTIRFTSFRIDVKSKAGLIILNSD